MTKTYEPPKLIATYAIEQLVREAAQAMPLTTA